MKKFIVIYHAPAKAMAQMANATPEQKMEGMKPWLVWAKRCGDQLVDMGAPLFGGQVLNASSQISGRGKSTTEKPSSFTVHRRVRLIFGFPASDIGHPAPSY